MKRSYIHALSAVLIWSTMPPVGKLLLSDFNALEVLGYGSLIGAFTLIIVLIVTGGWKDIRNYKKKDLIAVLLLGFVGYFLYSLCYNTGLSLLPAYAAGTLNYIWPVFALVLSAVFSGETLTVFSISSIFISLSGVFLLLSSSESQPGGMSAKGVCFCLMAALLYAIFNIGNKKLGKNPALNMTIYLLTGGMLSLLFNIPNGYHTPAGLEWTGFLWLGVMIDALAYCLWALALRRESTASIVNLTYLTPIFSTLLSVIFFGESISGFGATGLVLILSGVFLQSKTSVPAAT